MQSSFGTNQAIALIQASWVTTTFTQKAGYGGSARRTAAGVIVLTIPSLPPTAPGATENTTGVNDNNIMVQEQQFGGVKVEVDIVYGPNPSAPVLLANEIQLTYASGADPASKTVNFVVYNCNDGLGFNAPETP